ncbi:MAG: DUF1194 domain-containing protein [Geminicoccaceae bacterium]|nr:DUF1194 domain-containing protein [Geminicoccaceae bacterium]MCS7267387.1 DUF1194 domain-containing protein [Geminicoccaceae bacterium]MCX7629512.1 DUF1194 domain-containing protein [Geminicoccaceae bacterium]MDW8123610.1 DUF1194 domain-containing protein [Geminicoccaceae bacterium]MDW8339951.1 DUF1194 domain-containing protein [Geminicoccaceae bacterium]
MRAGPVNLAREAKKGSPMRSGRLISALILLCTSASAPAAEVPVDLELVLAVDVSGSVDDVEAHQQRQGYIDALRDPLVHRAIAQGAHRRIAVTYIEWAGAGWQQTVIPWTLLDGPEACERFAAQLAETPIGRGRWTSISGAIDYAVRLFDGNGFDGERKVIDISGDGTNNNGRPVEDARWDALEKGIVINGLPILNDRPQPFGMPTPRQLALDDYYERWVIGGPGSFIVVANDFDDFRRAVLAKLVREIAGTGGPRRVAASDR